MQQKNIQLTFFVALTLCVFAFSFAIFKPYLGVIFVSCVFAVVFYPLYEKLLGKFKGRKSLAALATTMLILFFIIIPLIVASIFMFREAVDLYNSIAFGRSFQNFANEANVILGKLGPSFLGYGLDWESHARSVLGWVIGHFDSVFAAVFGGILNFVLSLLSIYYLLIYGRQIKKRLVLLSPLPDEYDEGFIKTLKLSIDAVLRGRVLVALFQGVLIGMGFAVFGVGSPVLWGFIGAIASLIPVFGTSIITLPAVAYLFVIGDFWAGFGLAVWSVLIVGFADNAASMFFFKDKIKVHPLLVLFSILGGVEVFGALGFLIGPVAISAFVALMEIYPFILSYKSKPAA